MKHILFFLFVIAFFFAACPSASAQGRITRQTKPKTEPTEKVRPKTEPQPVAQPKIELSQPDGSINGHGYVDLGLPSGLKWATCNIGASTPEEYGNYYAWGETSTKTNYDSETCTLLNLKINNSNLTEYGVIDTLGCLNKDYDAANANWKSGWRMPTKDNFEELLNNCKWTWITRGETNGYIIVGPNGHSVFFPAAGCYSATSIKTAGKRGCYLSSTQHSFSDGYCLFFGQYDRAMAAGRVFMGYTVRPVSE